MPPLLADNTVHVYRANLDLPKTVIDRLASTLSVDEIERADRFGKLSLRNRFVCSRGLLRALLGRLLEIAPESLRFTYGPNGKPSLSDGQPRLSFNLSHSESLTLIAVCAGREVGVDIERVRPIKEIDRIAADYFTQGEGDYMNSADEYARLDRFFVIWTRKEACIKALGAGISGRVRDIETYGAPNEPARLAAENCRDGSQRFWRIWDVSIENGFRAAVAVEIESEHEDIIVESRLQFALDAVTE